MKRRIKPGFITMLALSLLLLLGSFMTMLPIPYLYASNLQGMKTLCPMAPLSTWVLVGLAVICLVACAGFFTESAQGRQP